ncbi:hypothetical protein EDD86DRAFT_249868 [Gorgonomyces haynaldii]|nr:hypothetical protein EDD86DRAFT_249868 [Gorgonomyces haynaldii]
MTRQSAYDTTQLLQNTRIALYLEHFFSLFGSLALKMVLLTMVEAVTTANLIVPVFIFGRKVDPARTLLIIRMVAMAVNFTWYNVWIWWALGSEGDYEKYKLLRRLTYVTWGCVSVFISAPVNYYFATKLFKEVQFNSVQESDQFSNRGTRVRSERDIFLLKYCFWGVFMTYIWIGIYFALYPILNETLSNDGQLVAKCVIDGSLIVVTSFVLYFLLNR